MALTEGLYAVILSSRRIGTLFQRGDYTRFVFNEGYLEDPLRPVLGLRFEQALRRPYASALRLPCWFSNLLPEGPLRQWVADSRDVSLDREMELLAEVGHDLPGAVQVIPTDNADAEAEWDEPAHVPDAASDAGASPWRFSLAGVALKFSMLKHGDRLTVPAVGDRGDWLVKFPDYQHRDVPRNEFAMMSLGREAGIDIPEIRLVHRDEVEGVPDRMWPNREEWAFAIKRFDRADGPGRAPIHIEDFAQIRDVYAHAKYNSTFETVGALAYRGRDLDSLREFARRLAFIILIGNGDAHLKNWSLIYPDGRVPRLSPAYDLVATQVYRTAETGPEDLGLKLHGSKSFDHVNLGSFARLEFRLDSRLGQSGGLLDEVAADVVVRAMEALPACLEVLADATNIRAGILDWVSRRAKSLGR